MEFNKNKIIFFTISAILIVSFLFLLLSLNSKKDSTKPNSSADSFNIWIVSETKVDTYGFITSFKNLNTKYKNKNIVIEVFPNFEDYYFSLNSALISDK
ncbi:MAG: hypothetical protein P1U46_01590 [Patescibacteria group bacterium]|nr:hypothetical protein [Patescibacteria group bacterium]